MGSFLFMRTLKHKDWTMWYLAECIADNTPGWQCDCQEHCMDLYSRPVGGES